MEHQRAAGKSLGLTHYSSASGAAALPAPVQGGVETSLGLVHYLPCFSLLTGCQSKTDMTTVYPVCSSVCMFHRTYRSFRSNKLRDTSVLVNALLTLHYYVPS